MNPKNITTLFLILKEIVLLVKLILDEWEKNDKENEEI